MTYPFHLSFVVPDLKLAEEFYTEFLNCKKGRDTGHWIDIIFYGHQLTLHQATQEMPARALDHFGVIMSKQEWLNLKQKVEQNGYEYVLPPKAAVKDDRSESGKFIIKDPAANLLEFKFYQASPIEMTQ